MTMLSDRSIHRCSLAFRVILIAAIVASLAACSARVAVDPIKDMTDPNLAGNWRMEAALQAEREFPGDPKRIEALHKIAWGERQTTELRIYAIDQLIAINEKDFREKLDRRIVLIPYGEVLDHIYAVGKERKWPELTPMLVKRWAVPQHGEPDDGRAERKWIAQLNPGREVEAVVFDVFTAPVDQITDLQRIGAWALLNRIATKEKLIAALNTAPQTTPLVTDLKAAAADLHTLPRHREGVKWLYFLRDPARSEVWQSAKSNVAALTSEQRINLEMRHLAILPHLDSQTRGTDRASLYQSLQSQLSGLRHYMTAPSEGSGIAEQPQHLKDWKDQLSWADLATIRTLATVVQNPKVKAELFAQADSDHKNKGAEHGGVIDIYAGTPTAREYPPLARLSHDRQFTPSEQMISHCYTGLAHYHFHAQELRNREYAGPGKGDLDTAERLDLNFLVFTFIDENQLNVDYYQHGRVVVDLGTISR